MARKRGFTIAFLGPDGSGKSTIIDGLLENDLPFDRIEYFHLKPILKPKDYLDKMVVDPHKEKPYSPIKSYFKLIYFIVQYNWGWYRNIQPLMKSVTLVIFDRYYDDILADPKRYRLNRVQNFANLVRHFIPKPDIYFILTTDANIIHARKQEVSLEELEKQVIKYQRLGKRKHCHNVDVNRSTEYIISYISNILNQKKH